jgi:hypothetical protein
MATKVQRASRKAHKPATVKAVPGTGNYLVAIVAREGLQVEDTWRAVNRLESKKPKGQIAFVDRFNLCTAKKSKARTVRKAVVR